ncbi:hypothetical protein MKX01_020919 [Papaver californicum]|nr:hypothetical protein MKX01_031070 [Papaver californicum]KAI3990234.1 hypothetical protein MKX01_020919 [Papaver californicum]
MSSEIQEENKNETTTKMEMNNFKFNVHAPEFVPRTQPQPQQTQMPISGYIYPCIHFLGSTSNGSDWYYVADQETIQLIPNSNSNITQRHSSNFLTEDIRRKIIKQVEYQFSDMSLFASDTLMKHISKDPEGYVPLSVIASSKKIKSLVSNSHLLIQALRTSSKLVVSDDGKKVKRKHLFTDRDKEDLQARTVVAENLPEDYTHQNLEKIFGVVGSVKTVRICHPQESNVSRPKGDVLISNKLHALVEYETVVQAEKAVEKLNDERNWRKGLRVRLLLRRSPRSVMKIKVYDHFEGISEDETASPVSADESSQPNNVELQTESNIDDNTNGSKKGWARGRGKNRGRSQNHSGRGLTASSPQSSCLVQCEASINTSKQAPRGPRMPDGTRGFTMGRGKPLTSSSAQLE